MNANTGSVSITAGAGGIVEAAANTTAAMDIANVPNLSLLSAGAVGSHSQPLQLSGGAVVAITGSDVTLAGSITSFGTSFAGAPTAINGNVSLTDSDAGTLDLTVLNAGGSVTVSNTGSIFVVTKVTAASGNPINLTTGGALTLKEVTTTGTLTTSSVTGTSSAGSQPNSAASLSATNSGSGNFAFINTVPLTILGISETGGTVSVSNSGAVTVTGAVVDAGSGAITITAVGSDVAMNVNANVASANGPITFYATGNLSVGTGVTINSGAAALILGADMTAAGLGDNGVGTLVINGTAQVDAASITLRGADEDVASTATVGSAVSTFVSSGLNSPSGLAFDSAGNLYIANAANSTISKVTPTGSVSTFVSSGLNLPGGLAFDSSGNLYVANANANSVSKVTPAGVVSTFASGLHDPIGLAFDAAGNLYVANDSNNTIAKVTPGGSVSTFVSGGLTNPYALAFSAGNLYVADTSNPMILKVTSGGSVSTFVSSPGTISDPDGLAFDSAGNLVVANGSNNSIFEVTPSGSISTLVAGTSELNSPRAWPSTLPATSTSPTMAPALSARSRWPAR